jgi:hypothetical protein
METERRRRDPLGDEQGPSTEDWQARVDRLQEVVCVLLIKNQAMRMCMPTEPASEQFGGSL